MSRRKKICFIIFLIVLDIFIGFTTYLKIYFPTTNVIELLFSANYGLSNSDFTPIIDALVRVVPCAILLFIILYLLFFKKGLVNHRKLGLSILTIFTIFLSLYNFNLFDTIRNEFTYSKFIENNYVNPKDVKVTFKDKKNLVFIVLESFEGTLMDEKNGGSWDYNLLPEVSKIDNKDYTQVFYNTDNKIGYKMVSGATYTSASLVTNNSAVPFKYKIASNLDKSNFMSGAYTLGDLLYDNGYHNELISSATTSFGGVSDFFSKHGKYNIIDVESYKKYKFTLKEEDLIDWGFNDKYTFETAKKRLDYLSKQNKPFNLTLIGIDTHFPHGYRSNYTINKYNDEYANVYRTESMLLKDFIDYVSKKDYFKDTVFVIVGDHLSMQKDFYSGVSSDDRFVYASYINATKASKLNNRKYTALDTYPSILGAMGAKIDGNKIGLGVNMFSNEKTLAETYGYKKLNSELSKNSKYYYKNIY